MVEFLDFWSPRLTCILLSWKRDHWTISLSDPFSSYIINCISSESDLHIETRCRCSLIASSAWHFHDWILFHFSSVEPFIKQYILLHNRLRWLANSSLHCQWRCVLFTLSEIYWFKQFYALSIKQLEQRYALSFRWMKPCSLYLMTETIICSLFNAMICSLYLLSLDIYSLDQAIHLAF